MDDEEIAVWERAVLDGGPADGLRVRVAHRPRVLQVTYPCVVENAGAEVRADALHVYRFDFRVQGEPLRYGFDWVSP
ncbi:hypothetical protein NKH18_08565 [Streptomyces sp. M10(2022)]